MILAEALLLRTNLQKRKALLRNRLQRSLVVQEGDKPIEDPEALAKRLKEESEELSRLVAAISHTNETNIVIPGQEPMSITQALAHKEHLKFMVTLLRDMAESSRPIDRLKRSEIRLVSVMDAATLQEEADQYARELEALVLNLHRVYWSVMVEEKTRRSAARVIEKG